MDRVVGDVAILDDGTCWRLPRSKRDLIWRCTWAQDTITKEDFLVIASYLSGYQYMVEEMTQKNRNTTCEKIKKLMKEIDSGYKENDSQ